MGERPRDTRLSGVLHLHEVFPIFTPVQVPENSPRRFNPLRIDAIEMTLAAVMNSKGNGNKDEVVFQTLEEIFQLALSVGAFRPIPSHL